MRWTPARKEEIILKVTNNLITRPEACEQFRISEEELAGWITAYRTGGLAALKVTKRLDRNMFR